MEFTGIQSVGTTRPDTGFEGDVGQGAQSAAAVPVLGGAGVTVETKTDFEKLLAEMEMKRDELKQRTLAGEFASALATLTSQYAAISSEKAVALEDVSAKASAAEAAQKASAAAQEKYDASVDVLKVLNDELSALIAEEVTTPEDRKKKIDAERRIEEAETAERTEAEETEEEKKEDSSKVRELKEKIARQEAVVERNAADLAAAKAAYKAAGAALADSLGILDQATFLAVVKTARNAAKDIAAAAAEQPDGKERGEKANAIVQALDEYVERLQEMQDEELEELIAKVAEDVVFLMRAERTIAPGELPEYEQKV